MSAEASAGAGAGGVRAEGKSPEGQSYGSAFYRNYVLIVLTLVYTLNFIDRNLLAVIGQPIIRAFGLSDSEYGFLNGPPFALFYALMGVPIAMAADRTNRVVLISICIALWSLMAALCGFATSFLFLLVARVGVAIGEAGGTPPANSLIGDYFKARSRANALGIYATGVTLGAALSNAFGGPIATNLNGANVMRWLEANHLDWAIAPIDWAHVEGWRIAFVAIGAPGLLVALLTLLTVKEPPRGVSDPPGASAPARASIVETLKEIAVKPTFWSNAMAASLTAFVGYGLNGFQAPMAQRVHGISPGQFALEFGVPLALCAAFGTFAGGYLIERLSKRSPSAVAWLPAVGLLVAIPLYDIAFSMPTAQLKFALALWCTGAAFHYSYLGSQYTIAQGVVSMRSRASAVAILLFCVALIGNGLGPPIVGWMSDVFMHNQLATHGGGDLSVSACRVLLTGHPGKPANYAEIVAALSPAQKAMCASAYGEGLRQSMAATALIFVPAAAFFLLAALTHRKDVVAKPA